MHTLARLQKKEARAQYFEQTNRRRALGQLVDGGRPTNDGPSILRNASTTTMSITGKISTLFKVDAGGAPAPGQEAIYINLLLKYLDNKHYGLPTCYLCSTTFESWEGVWKHSNMVHARGQKWPLEVA